MIIKSTNIYNTGGGCMVMYMDVDYCGELSTVAINDEVIVGHDCDVDFLFSDEYDFSKNDLWIATDWETLVDAVGYDTAVCIRTEYDSKWKYFNIFTGNDE